MLKNVSCTWEDFMYPQGFHVLKGISFTSLDFLYLKGFPGLRGTPPVLERDFLYLEGFHRLGVNPCSCA